jgi:hypothetical protein
LQRRGEIGALVLFAVFGIFVIGYLGFQIFTPPPAVSTQCEGEDCICLVNGQQTRCISNEFLKNSTDSGE